MEEFLQLVQKILLSFSELELSLIKKWSFEFLFLVPSFGEVFWIFQFFSARESVVKLAREPSVVFRSSPLVFDAGSGRKRPSNKLQHEEKGVFSGSCRGGPDTDGA